MINVHIRKNATNEVRIYKCNSPWSGGFMWSDGNYACDCNRAIFFGDAGGTNEEMECGETRYTVRIEDADGHELYRDDRW